MTILDDVPYAHLQVTFLILHAAFLVALLEYLNLSWLYLLLLIFLVPRFVPILGLLTLTIGVLLAKWLKLESIRFSSEVETFGILSIAMLFAE